MESVDADRRFPCEAGGEKVDLILTDKALRLGDGKGATTISFDSVALYEAGRWEGVGPEWGLKIISVTWKLYFWGKTSTEHVFKLLPQGAGDDALLHQEGALNMLKALDRAFFAWQRSKLSLKSEDLTCSSVSLMRPNVGIEAAQEELKRSGQEETISEDALSTSMQDFSLERKKSSSDAAQEGPTRSKPGETLFCDEEALSIPGYTTDEQPHIFGVRCPGQWSVWKTGIVSVMVSQELVPAMLILSPGAIVLCLPTASMFVPFPLDKVAGWGASADAFSFRYMPVKGVFHTISFSNWDSARVLASIDSIIDFTLKGAMPRNPFPTKY